VLYFATPEVIALGYQRLLAHTILHFAYMK